MKRPTVTNNNKKQDKKTAPTFWMKTHSASLPLGLALSLL